MKENANLALWGSGNPKTPSSPELESCVPESSQRKARGRGSAATGCRGPHGWLHCFALAWFSPQGGGHRQRPYDISFRAEFWGTRGLAATLVLRHPPPQSPWPGGQHPEPACWPHPLQSFCRRQFLGFSANTVSSGHERRSGGRAPQQQNR